MNTPSFDQKILEKIRERQVSICSRKRLMVRRVCFVGTLTLIALFLSLLASFALYALHRTGALYLPILGGAVSRYFLHPFSWFTGLLVFGGLALVLLFGLLVHRENRLYRMPLVYVWLLFGVAFMGVGICIFLSPLHNSLRSYAESHRVPFIASLYSAASEGMETHTATGMVYNVTSEGFTLVTLSKKVVTVHVNDATRYPQGYTVHDGDAVIVVGRTFDAVLSAEAVYPSPKPLSMDEERELRNTTIDGIVPDSP